MIFSFYQYRSGCVFYCSRIARKAEAYTNDIIMQIRNLDVSYDGKLVLHDISMDIRKNRITAILGPSGCGKTTFLKTLNGLLQEERGAKVSGTKRNWRRL